MTWVLTHRLEERLALNCTYLVDLALLICACLLCLSVLVFNLLDQGFATQISDSIISSSATALALGSSREWWRLWQTGGAVSRAAAAQPTWLSQREPVGRALASLLIFPEEPEIWVYTVKSPIKNVT